MRSHSDFIFEVLTLIRQLSLYRALTPTIKLVADWAVARGLGSWSEADPELFVLNTRAARPWWSNLEEDETLLALHVAKEALDSEYAMHHVCCEMDLTGEDLPALKSFLEKVLNLDRGDRLSDNLPVWLVVGREPDGENSVKWYKTANREDAIRSFVKDLRDEGCFAGEEDTPCEDLEVCIDAVVRLEDFPVSVEIHP